MRDTIRIEIWNGEEIRIHATGAAELFRDGTLVASPRFTSIVAAQKWADAILERAAKSSPRAICINCEG